MFLTTSKEQATSKWAESLQGKAQHSYTRNFALTPTSDPRIVLWSINVPHVVAHSLVLDLNIMRFGNASFEYGFLTLP